MTNPLTPGQLTGARALITGSSRGIGAKTAEYLAEAGASVVINYRNKEARAQKLVESIQSSGGTAMALGADLTDPVGVARMIGAIRETLGGLDVTVRRNAFGSQVDSHETDVAISGVPGPAAHVAFIRAPLVTEVGAGVEVIARLSDGRIVGVRQGARVGVAFHPEITGDDRLHRVFVEDVRKLGFRLSTLQTA
jgi:pyridoxal 5'-phosphate synthase glutaminase subunit Pdx2